MFNDHLLRPLSEIRVAESQRFSRTRIEPRSGASPRRLAPVADGVVTVRHAKAVDFDGLARLAARESRRIPTGELYVAERAGRLVAAVSIDTGAVLADSNEPTTEIIELLRLQAGAASTQTARPLELESAA